MINRVVDNLELDNCKFIVITQNDIKKNVENSIPESWTVIEGHLRMTGGWWLLPKGGEWPENFPDKYCHLHIEF